MSDDEWYEALDAGFEAVFEKMEERHMKMMFALNMICEFCRRDSSLEMGKIHKMALFGLGYDHEEESEAKSDE